MNFTPDNILSLRDNEIFVFGSNVNGQHCSGAARVAYEKFDAIWGKGVGMQGRSYGIPTMSGDLKVLRAYVDDFIEFALTHPKLTFLVTRIGCGIAGYKDEQIAPLFKNTLNMQNVILPKSFVDVMLPSLQNSLPAIDPYLGMKYRMDMIFHLSFGKTFVNDDFVFFWKDLDNNSKITKTCLSQWYFSPFMIDNQWYSCAEQYMMAEKAQLFGDYEIRNQILKQSDQMMIKKLGRAVHNFKEDVWLQHRYEIIKRGNIAKFSQNKRLKEYLLSTDNKILVEASPFDVIYGIGMEEHSANILDPHKWRGLNLLGFVLMEVRDILCGRTSYFFP